MQQEPLVVRVLGAVSVGWLGISMVADGLPALLLPYLVASTGGNATTLGLVTFAGIAAAAMVQPFAGAWSDHIGRATVTVAGLALAAAGLGLLLTGALLPATVLALTGVGVAQAGYQGLLPDRVRPAWRGRGAGAKGLADVGGAFLGFALLGGLLAAGNGPMAIAVLVLALLASLGLALLMAGSKRGGPMRTPPGAAARDARPMPPGLVQLIVARFLFLLGIYAVGRFLVLFIGERLALGPEAAAGAGGLVLAVLAGVTAAAALPSGWLTDRIGRRPLMAAGGLLAAAGIATMPLVASIPAVLAAGALMAAGTAAFGAGSWAMQADLSAGPHAGRLMGIANFGTAGAAAAAGLLGPLIDATGYSAAFALAATVTAAGGMVGWREVSVHLQPVEVSD